MLNNVVLDVFIGLIFVFLLYSLLATILQELIASRFGLRGRMLQKALRRMLEDGVGGGRYMLVNYFSEIKDNIKRFLKPIDDTMPLLKRFYDHPTIKYLGEGKLFSKPSYLHAHNFSQTIIHLLRGDDYDGRKENESELIAKELSNAQSTINPQTLKQLKLLFYDARQDSFIFKQKLEDWFEEMMERTTGWYKKQAQVILICIGFVLAIAFNVDSIAITKILMKDKKVREQMVEMAISRQKEYGSILDTLRTTIIKQEIKKGDTTTVITDSVVKARPSDEFLDSVKKRLMDDARDVQGILGLRGIPTSIDSSNCTQSVSVFDEAIGRETNPANKRKLDSLRKKAYAECMKGIKASSPYQTNFFLKLIGWLITALAISLGAPFWFDLLNKLVKLRESGPRVANQSAMDNPAVATNNPVKDANNTDIKG